MTATKNRILVTGSTGCIGTHAVNVLLEEGECEVFGFNRSEPEGEQSREGYHFFMGDLADPQSIERAVREIEPTHVIHLGALQTPDCRDFPIKGMEINVLGTAHLFQACTQLKRPLDRFVFASSSAVNGARSLYGADGVRPEDPYHPFNLYGYWKVAGEGMAQAFHQATGVSTVSLRLATTYGPGRDRGFTAAMTSAIKAIVQGELPHQGNGDQCTGHSSSIPSLYSVEKTTRSVCICKFKCGQWSPFSLWGGWSTPGRSLPSI